MGLVVFGVHGCDRVVVLPLVEMAGNDFKDSFLTGGNASSVGITGNPFFSRIRIVVFILRLRIDIILYD